MRGERERESEQLIKTMLCFKGKYLVLRAEICTANALLISDTVIQNCTTLIAYCSVAHRIRPNFLLPQHLNCLFSFWI